MQSIQMSPGILRRPANGIWTNVDPMGEGTRADKQSAADLLRSADFFGDE